MAKTARGRRLVAKLKDTEATGSNLASVWGASDFHSVTNK